MRILLVEDEDELAGALRSGLGRHGVVVDHVGNLASAQYLLGGERYDALVLDRRLPDGEGLSLIGALRARGNNVPILVLTALDDLGERVKGLEQGADDYLGKPFALDELLARLRALCRRPAAVRSDTVRAGRLSFDLASREAVVGGIGLALRRRELLVLETLLGRTGRMVLRTMLMNAVFGVDDEIQSNALDTHVSRLRRKLLEADAGVAIDGIRGLGYVLREAA